MPKYPWGEWVKHEGYDDITTMLTDLLNDVWTNSCIADLFGVETSCVRTLGIRLGLGDMMKGRPNNKRLKQDNIWRERAHTLGFKCERDLLMEYRYHTVDLKKKMVGIATIRQIQWRYQRWDLMPCHSGRPNRPYFYGKNWGKCKRLKEG